MSGYIGRSMSKNAYDAYKKGLITKSKITKQLLVNEGWNYSASFFYWLCKKKYILPVEMHHTTPRFVKTAFYNLGSSVRFANDKFDLWSLYELYLKRCSKQDILKRKGVKYVRISIHKKDLYTKDGSYLDCIDYNNLYWWSKEVCFSTESECVNLLQEFEFGNFDIWQNQNKKTVERQICMLKDFYRNPK